MSGYECEVVVVGAGPAGATVARRLAEVGHEVVLLDRSPTPRTNIVCTGIVGLEAFRRFDLPVEAVLGEIPAACFLSPSGVMVRYEPRHAVARVVDRHRFDALLAKRAEEAGARLLRGWEARELRRPCGGGRVGRGSTRRRQEVLEVEIRNGRPDRIRARAVVIATGYRRNLHRQAGLGSPAGCVHGVHADFSFVSIRAAELYFGSAVAPGFFAWVVPSGPGRARLGLLVSRRGRDFFERFLGTEAIRRRVGGEESARGRSCDPILSRGIVQGPVSPSFADGVLAVGEAAGQVKTTTAGGIYYGMLGAEIAAEVLHDGLRAGNVSRTWLSRYEDRWRRRLGAEIQTGLELQRAARAMDDDRIDDLFEALSSGLAQAIRGVVKFDWHHSALRMIARCYTRWPLGTGGLVSTDAQHGSPASSRMAPVARTR